MKRAARIAFWGCVAKWAPRIAILASAALWGLALVATLARVAG